MIPSFLAILLLPVLASAYTITTTKSGQPVRWRDGQKFFLAGNPTGRENFSPTFFWNTVVNGLQQWKWATQSPSGTGVDFEYWQGTDPKIYKADLQQNGYSTIFFASNSKDAIDPNVIGYTQVWYNEDSGTLLEADIMLNDRDYELTANARDTSSASPPPSSVGSHRRNVFIGNIITHELGHALGLSHSGNINASMLYVEYSDQSKLGCDDWAGIRHLYTPAKDGTGVLTGRVIGPNGQSAAGAQVTAISQARGIPIASVVTDQEGVFNFGALEAGAVSLSVTPFASPKSIPVKFQSKTTAPMCANNNYPTQFFTEPDGHQLKTIIVQAGSASDAGAIHLQCNEIQDSGTELNPRMFNGTTLIADRGENGTTHTYHFVANGPFKVTGLGYLLLSPIKVDLQVFDSAGNPIAVEKHTPLYESASSKFAIPDTEITGNAVGPIQVQVTAQSLPATDFPTPAIWPGQTPYFIIDFNAYPTDRFASFLPDNARCAPPENSFKPYHSPAGSPLRFSSTQSTRDGVGFCGNAEAADRTHPRIPTPLGSILGWFMPFFVAIGAQLSLRFFTKVVFSPAQR